HHGRERLHQFVTGGEGACVLRWSLCPRLSSPDRDCGFGKEASSSWGLVSFLPFPKAECDRFEARSWRRIAFPRAKRRRIGRLGQRALFSFPGKRCGCASRQAFAASTFASLRALA